MFWKVFWKYAVGVLVGLSFLALVLPQFRVVFGETEQVGYIYIWGKSATIQADVSATAYIIAAIMGVVAAALMGGGYRYLLRGERKAIGLMNWAAFFIAVELAFLLGISEEVLSDLRAYGVYADSYASWGGGISEFLLFVLLFFMEGMKKAYFKVPSPESSAS